MVNGGWARQARRAGQAGRGGRSGRPDGRAAQAAWQHGGRAAWRPGGQMIATASMKGGALMLLLLRRDGTIYNRHTLGDGKCVWLEWESKGASALQDRVCSGVAFCTSAQWEQSAPTATTNRVCKALTTERHS